MNNITRCLAALTVTPLLANAAHTAQIEFEIQGIKAGDGKLYVQLFKGQNNYEKGDAQAAMIVMPESETETIRFNNVSPGDYAIRFFHDENNSGQLETNLFGLPTEGYGFSNNAKPDFGPVSFAAMMFTVKETDTQVVNSTHVIY